MCYTGFKNGGGWEGVNFEIGCSNSFLRWTPIENHPLLPPPFLPYGTPRRRSSKMGEEILPDNPPRNDKKEVLDSVFKIA
jgi:hypothetical protein